jgi:hypothetical protein
MSKKIVYLLYSFEMSSNDKSESTPPNTPPATPNIEPSQEPTDVETAKSIHPLMLASAMAMVNQFKKVGQTTTNPSLPTSK